MTRSAPVQFPIRTLEDLAREARRLKVDLPLAPRTDVLAQPVIAGGRRIPNRLCVQPMEGGDAAGGVPGDLTFRRYLRYAEGGFGLVWLEATAVNHRSRSNPRQLWLSRRSAPVFAKLVEGIRQAARRHWGHEAVIVLQLAHAGRYSNPDGVSPPVIACHVPEWDRRSGVADDCPVISDAELDRLQDEYVAAGRLAVEAGCDGVDIKACHGDLLSELLAAATRAGKYGGSFENRSRFLRETVSRIREAVPQALLAVRLGASEQAMPRRGACADADELPPAKPAATTALARALRDAGATLLNVTCGDFHGDDSGAGQDSLAAVVRSTQLARAVQEAVPAVPVVSGGYSWLRHLLPHVAAGVVNDGGAALIGVGRAALAYPSLAGDLLRTGQLDPDRCCLTCSACTQLLRDGGTAGCVIMDRATYGEEYRRRRRSALDHLREESRRCQGCVPAPCRTGCATGIDIPGFLKAFGEDDLEAAYRIIRTANVLPETCARLCLPGQMCQGRCILGTLDGNPIPIHDVQYAVCWQARQRGLTGVRLPNDTTGKRVAIVGGGPAGVACAVSLLEAGHQVCLFERRSELGGTPDAFIRRSRFDGGRDEMTAVLQPALRAGRLTVRFGIGLGTGVSLQELRAHHHAVFLAPGVWAERTLGRAEGVVDGLSFLRRARSGEIKTVPPDVIILAGGDSAADSAVVAGELGARQLTVVYEGALADMNWHMPDSWFRAEGVCLMTSTRPLGYETTRDGRLGGVRIRVRRGADETSGAEGMLKAGLVIEAMGLGLESSLVSALEGCTLTDGGLIATAGHGSFACGLTGVYAGGGAINGGAAVVQCVDEGMRAGVQIDRFLRSGAVRDP